MKYYTGKNNTVYYLEDTPIGRGGEGIVYAVSNNPSLVAKLYLPRRLQPEDSRKELQAKIEAMLSYKIKTHIDGVLRVAWAEDALYDNGAFAGYIMPKVTFPYKIYDVYRNENRKYTWKSSVQFAYNLSWVVWYLHLNDIIIGDMNPNNIAIGEKGEVALLDCASFDIWDKRTGHHFPCAVGLEELLAPELQTVGKLTNGSFTKESDCFSLAIHIFRLLMNNADPFGGKVTGYYTESQSAIPANRAIINGESPYFRTIPNKEIPDYAPNRDFLPPDLFAAFDRTFNYTATTAKKSIKNRTTAEEWTRLLLKYAAPEPNPNLQTCKNDPTHVYPIHHTTCPFCGYQSNSGLRKGKKHY